MKRLVGLLLLITGLVIGGTHYLEWKTGRTAAQDLTEQEIEAYVSAAAEAETEAADDEPALLPNNAEKKLPPAPESVSPVLTSETAHATGEQVAALLIPKLGQKYSVYWGADDASLTRGVGMYVSDLTTIPGGHGHTVLSGHRDTVFTRLGELEKHDHLLVEYGGQTFTYEVTDTWITDAEDRSVIVEKENSVLTLTTCYPFDFFGDAPDRYIVQAKLVK